MSFSEDPTQGREGGETPYEDPSQGEEVGERRDEDPSQGGEVGERRYEDPSQGGEVGERPYEDPSQGDEIGVVRIVHQSKIENMPSHFVAIANTGEPSSWVSSMGEVVRH